MRTRLALALLLLSPAFAPAQTPEIEAALKTRLAALRFVTGLYDAPVRASAVHHSGTHPVLVVRAGGQELRCTANHPLLSLAVVDGVPADEAVAYVRREYSPRAVETPWQRRFVARFEA